jgi:predicted kinase
MLAGAIAARYSLYVLAVDQILSCLMPGSDRRELDRIVGYRAMLLIARELLQRSHSVLLDATFTTNVSRTALARLTSEVHCRMHLIQCRVSPEVAATRFVQRVGHPAIDLDMDRVRSLALNYPYQKDGLIVDNDRPVSVTLQQVDEYLQQEPRFSEAGVDRPI